MESHDGFGRSVEFDSKGESDGDDGLYGGRLQRGLPEFGANDVEGSSERTTFTHLRHIALLGRIGSIVGFGRGTLRMDSLDGFGRSVQFDSEGESFGDDGVYGGGLHWRLFLFRSNDVEGCTGIPSRPHSRHDVVLGFIGSIVGFGRGTL